VACRIAGTIEVERASNDQLLKRGDTPVTPFDPGSYVDVLKLIAGNLDSKGTYRDVLAKDDAVPVPGEHLVVADAWVLVSRPRAINYLFDDLQRPSIEAGGRLRDSRRPGFTCYSTFRTADRI
jgi:hypothetical protein